MLAAVAAASSRSWRYTARDMTSTIKASVFVGTSLDGFIARSNGDLDFLPPGGGERHGYSVFMATVDVLGIGGVGLISIAHPWG